LSSAPNRAVDPPVQRLVAAEPPPVRREITTAAETVAANGQHSMPLPLAAAPSTPAASERTTNETMSSTALLDRVDEMMSRLEERILEELERRGGRFTGYF
jgi:beta-mannanase